jgi:hypothetical protein
MASNTVAVRLPDEVLEELQKRAAAQQKKVSDVVRDLIISGLQNWPPDSETNGRVIEYLEGFGGVLMAILFETARSRYFAEMATSYGVDMESLLRQNIPMDKEAKAALMSQFEAAAMQIAQDTWTRVLSIKH